MNEFKKLRTDTYQRCITGDSRNLDLVEVVKNYDANFASLIKTKKIRGIFSSPP